MAVTANQAGVPAGERPRQLQLDVKDHQGRGAPSEVTLWAVDYGVLSLTAYQHARRRSDPSTFESRCRSSTPTTASASSSRRVLTPKGETDGGGGGADAGAGTLRKDFRVLAFWLGSVTTDANGQRERGRHAAGVADDLSNHGGRRRIATRASDPATAKFASTSR